MNHTTNYDLPQWEDSDRVTRSDMNAAMAGIDAALASGTRTAYGYYVGTGVCGYANYNSLTFEFTPKIVLLLDNLEDYAYITPERRPVVIFWGASKWFSMNESVVNAGNVLRFDGNKLWWYLQNTSSSEYAKYQLNKQNARYYYFA